MRLEGAWRLCGSSGDSPRRRAARLVGIAPSYLSRIETGRVHPTVRTAVRLASALKISLDALSGPALPGHGRRPCPVSRGGHCFLDVLRAETAAPVASGQVSSVLIIGMAVGIDYSLFYLRREREERAAGASTARGAADRGAHLGPGHRGLRADRDDRAGRAVPDRVRRVQRHRDRHDRGGRRGRAGLADRAARAAVLARPAGPTGAGSRSSASGAPRPGRPGCGPRWSAGWSRRPAVGRRWPRSACSRSPRPRSACASATRPTAASRTASRSSRTANRIAARVPRQPRRPRRSWSPARTWAGPTVARAVAALRATATATARSGRRSPRPP